MGDGGDGHTSKRITGSEVKYIIILLTWSIILTEEICIDYASSISTLNWFHFVSFELVFLN